MSSSCCMQDLHMSWIFYKSYNNAEVLKKCVTHLNNIPTDIFITLLTLLVSQQVPVLQNCHHHCGTAQATCLNEYCPFALNPATVKCLKQQVMTHIKTSIPPTLDPLFTMKFAYRQTHCGCHVIGHTLGCLLSI